LLVRRAGDEEWQPFTDAFGTASGSKFSNVRLHRGDTIMLRTPSGGGYGPPHERPPEAVATDVRERIVSVESAERLYRVALHPDGSVDEKRTDALRSPQARAAPGGAQ
jgi:N-methylhydantoinase B/oxoprolinase/acetone carboxylase alpha subunit